MHEQTVLEVHVNHLKESIGALKADFEHMNTKIDPLSACLTEHRLETERSLGKLRHETVK